MSSPESAQTGSSTTDEQQLTRLNKSRSAHKGVITRLTRASEALLRIPGHALTTSQKEEIERLEEAITLKLKDIESKNKQIEELVEDVDLENEVDAASDYSTDVRKLLKQMRRRLEETSLDASVQSASTANPTMSSAKLKLPTMQLANFDGNYLEWTSFRDIFESSVHNNTNLSDSQKLHYLKTALKGNAARLLSSITVTDANYAIARDILNDRFQNKRALVKAHIEAMMSIPKGHQENVRILRNVQEILDQNRRALENQGVNVKECDFLLLHLVTEKLDPETRKEWELSSTGSDLQTYDQFKDFLEKRCRALESSCEVSKSQKFQTVLPASAKHSSETKSSQWRSSGSRPPENGSSKTGVYSGVAELCFCCGENHKIQACQTFNDLIIEDKLKMVQSKGLCYNCLRKGHTASECSSQYKCRTCGSKHHTLIHQQRPRGDESRSSKTRGSASVSNHSSHTFSKQTLLPTAMIPVQSRANNSVYCRAFFDSRSEISCITESCVQTLGLSKKRNYMEINGLGSENQVKSRATVDIPVIVEQRIVIVEAFVLTKITNNLPSTPVPQSQFKNLANLKLADPRFNEPSSIDILLGADVIEKFTLGGKIQENENLFLKDTVFGWVVTGQTKIPSSQVRSHHVSTDAQLSRFWELEELPAAMKYSQEEIDCEDHFKETTTRDETGRFIVSLPFKRDTEPLGESLAIARQRFNQLEKKLERNPDLKKKYSDFIEEFLQMDHMEIIPSDEIAIEPNRSNYLPHHCVIKDSSTTTKLRVVFDGSAKTSSNRSLNQNLMIGPKIQDDIFGILLRFQIHAVTLSADVEKMYRQIKLDTPAKDFHRILWKFESQTDVSHLRMKRVTYGISSSSFHSIRALQEAGHQSTDPDVKGPILNDFYVDDLLTGAESVEEAKTLQEKLLKHLNEFGLPLRKWSSCAPQVVEDLPEALRETKTVLDLQKDDYTIKTLGVAWCPSSDTFNFQYRGMYKNGSTKRILLSEIAKIFDPMGWLSPCTIKLKILMQSTWTRGLKWDEPIPPDIHLIWKATHEELKNLHGIRFPRQVSYHRKEEIQLHVFADASESAYAAAIYARITTSDSIETKLLAAKTSRSSKIS